MKDYLEEEKHLKDTIKKFEEVVKELHVTIEKVSNNYELDADHQYVLVRTYKNKLRIVSNSIEKPYFARIDFIDDCGNNESCYLSKVGISDLDENIITVDWRVPIASLYYDYNLGDASYKSPEGIINGKLILKRQYEIDEGKLVSYRDVDTVSNDEILKPYLDVNADNRLKNIVSSIQGEQNTIIRKDISNNMIVQGVAGSGKTTVALHRIAYLAYNLRNTIKNNQYLVIGPNKFFIKYISSVLPDLDVNDVMQLTYLEFTNYFLNEKLNIKKSKDSEKIKKFKVSLEYKELLDSYLSGIDPIGIEDFKINDFLIIKNSEIKSIYSNLSIEMYPNIESRIERCIILLLKNIKENKETILNRLFNDLHIRIENTSSIEKLKKDYELCRKEIINGCRSSLKKYFKILNKRVSSFYQDFLIKKYNIKDIVEEDLPGLIYMCSKIKERQGFLTFRHTVIDEAQDYGEFHFYVLNKVLGNSTFSVFGDLAQSIYSSKSIENWECVKNNCFNGCEIEYLKKSYRTTIEIMLEANRVLKYIGYTEADPVIRHGSNVEYIKNNSNEEIVDKCIELSKKDYSTIAVICLEEEKESIKKCMNNKNLNYQEITEDNLDYDTGICIINRELVKGLEFDAVIISDASEDKYNSNDKIDMKKLYVSMTRPLHELIVFYNKELTLPLKYTNNTIGA